MPSPDPAPATDAHLVHASDAAGDGHDDFGGLTRDRGALGRRGALRLLGGLGLISVVSACGGSDGPATTASTDADAPTGGEIPDETAGPFPADGSNGPNALTEEGIVRRDITTSIGDLSGTASGLPTAFELTVVDADTDTPIEGAALYLWHCTAGGAYSIYEETDQNYLRGVQVTDAEGRLSFESIFPGCYPGRWPHAHVEVFESLDVATTGRDARKTTQLALPRDGCETVYTDATYGDSASSLAGLSLSGDVSFRDGSADQMATVVNDGSRATVSLVIRV